MCACWADQEVRIQDFLIGVQIFIRAWGGGGGGGGLLALTEFFFFFFEILHENEIILVQSEPTESPWTRHLSDESILW